MIVNKKQTGLLSGLFFGIKEPVGVAPKGSPWQGSCQPNRLTEG